MNRLQQNAIAYPAAFALQVDPSKHFGPVPISISEGEAMTVGLTVNR